VKETKNVKRNRAQIPTKLTHARPTMGDWLNKRYIVNNYILLEVLGTGSYGEVRLCKDRTSDKLFAIKIFSKDFLKKKVRIVPYLWINPSIPLYLCLHVGSFPLLYFIPLTLLTSHIYLSIYLWRL
jgi:serine/threonine protein kinase